MSRIAATFAKLRSEQRTALIPFITAGDPTPAVTVPAMHALVAAGADIVELGVPFSDPMAEGPVIQAACERALAHGVSLRDVLAMVRAFRATDTTTPVVLMGYLNPIEAMGYRAFAEALAEAGADGVITVDLPPDEARDLSQVVSAHGVDPVYLVAPTSTPERIRRITEAARGFVYYVSMKGVTGAAHLDVDAVIAKLAELRAYTDLPIGVGFGIQDGAAAAALAAVADAVIVGSMLVNRFDALQQTPEAIPADIAACIADLRAALDGAPR